MAFIITTNALHERKHKPRLNSKWTIFCASYEATSSPLLQLLTEIGWMAKRVISDNFLICDFLYQLIIFSLISMFRHFLHHCWRCCFCSGLKLSPISLCYERVRTHLTGNGVQSYMPFIFAFTHTVDQIHETVTLHRYTIILMSCHSHYIYLLYFFSIPNVPSCSKSSSSTFCTLGLDFMRHSNTRCYIFCLHV